jgi:hypothetical protein
MSGRNTSDGGGNEGLRSLFYSSDDARSFELMDTQGVSVCLVYIGYLGCEPRREALDWLQSFLRERFEKAFAEAFESGQKGSLVAFFQSAHADLFRERARWPEGLAQISLVAAHVHEDTIEIASVGTCATYRISRSGVERVIPSDGNGGEGCHLGASLKVSVEMVKRSLAQGVSYLLTSKRVDVSSSWSSNVTEAVRVAKTDAASGAHMLFGTETGSFVILGAREISEKEASEDKTLGTDVKWYKKLREELAGALQGQSIPSAVQGEAPSHESFVSEATSSESTLTVETTSGEEATKAPDLAGQHAEEFLSVLKTPRPKSALFSFAVKRAPLVALAVAVGVAIYVLWTNDGGVWAKRFFRGARIAGDQTIPVKTLRGTLSLNSTPPGAEIMLDDSVITPRTPVSLAAIPPGTHQIAMKLGELGEWTGNVAVQPGDTANVRVAFMGEIAVSSRPQEGLSVVLDGEPRGYTPCVLESVPAGLHIVRVEGKGFSAWEEEVVVTHGGIAEVQVSPGKLPETGLVRVTAGQVSEEGYQESNGRGVFIDGRKVGTTPLKIEVKPGFHSIRVTGLKGETPSVTVVQVRPGGKHFIRAEFAGAQPVLVECTQTRLSSGGQVIMHASLTGNADAEVSRVELYLEKMDSNRAGWESMTLLPGSHSVYAAAVPEGFVSGGGQIKYFVRVTTSEGLEYYSEVNTLTAR